MKINVTIPLKYDIILTPQQQLEITKKTLMNTFNLNGCYEYFIEDGYMCVADEYCGGGHYFNVIKKNLASEEDIAIVKVLDILKSRLSGAKS